MAVPAAIRVVEHHAVVYRRTWRGSVFSSFLNPVLFLAAMGLGLGSYVNSSSGGGGAAGSTAGTSALLGGVSYLAFLAPGLLASTAMQTAAGESTYPIMAAIVWIRSYLGMLATPIRVIDILIGQVTWIALRLLVVSTIFFGVMVAFGAVAGPAAVLAIPAAVLTGLAFVTPIVAFSATQRSDSGFAALFRFGMIPLFLFSGTFFPVSQLPAFLQPLAYVTPLWHGVDLCRTLALGTATTAGVAIHVAYLGAITAAGFWVAAIAFRRRLVT